MKPKEAEKLNDGQCAALDLGRDLLVSAGAGSGKTQVLGLRFLAILELGLATVPEIVAFTFTEKASAEMRQRVQKLLLARIAELAPASIEARRLREARDDFSRNRISTVHGFCHRLLRDYAWEAGIEPGAPVIDDNAQSKARDAAIARVLLRTDAAEQPELAQALVRLGAEVRLGALMLTLSRLVRERAAWGHALAAAARAWREPKVEIARRHAALQALVDVAIRPALDAISRIDPRALGATQGDTLRDLVVGVQEAAARGDGRKLRVLLLTGDGEPRKPGGAKTNWRHAPAMLDEVRRQVAEAAQALVPAAEILDFDISDPFEARAGQAVTDLALVFEHVRAAYAEECAGALDFLEMELRTLALLRENRDVRAEVIHGIRYLLVDEYQDTNPTQAELFKLLDSPGSPGRFFAVGDAKQSIYAFRGSDVAVFNNALDEIPVRNAALAGTPQALPWGLTCQDTPGRRKGVVHLAHNYRTVASVMELGNRVFDSVFGHGPWREFDAHPQKMRPNPENKGTGKAELHLLPQKPGNDGDRKRKDDEAELVAQRVAALRGDGVPLKDIAILVRRRSRNRHFRAAFARHGLPLVVTGEGGLFETQEALDCVNLLRVLANPGDDIGALGLLRSPMAGLSDAELTSLALTAPESTHLLQRLEKWDGRPAQADKFCATIRELAAKAGRVAPALLLADALAGFGYALAVSCGHEAEQRLANVERMLELVREMQRRTPSLAPLVRELVARIDRGEDETQGVAQAGTDAVRLMTIHHAKGLDFRVVIVPDIGSNPGPPEFGPVRDLPLAGQPLGLHLKILEDDGRGEWRMDFAAWQARREAKLRAEAESKRVLYVAWTRAIDRLILVGTVGDISAGESWAHQVAAALGITSHGSAPATDALELRWYDAVAREAPRPRTAAIDAVRKALKAGRVPLPAGIDTSIVMPLEHAVPGRAPDLAAVEVGTLVHAELERCLRLRSKGLEVGVLDARAVPHVNRALDALDTLAKAKSQHPEFEFRTPQGTRRLDLLRELDGDRFEIIDYKTDTVDGDPREFALANHALQLREYCAALKSWLAQRGRGAKSVRLLVCFTAPERLQPRQRLVEIPS